MNINPAMLIGGDVWRDSRKRQKVRIIGGIPEYIGKEGVILGSDEGGSSHPESAVRIALPHFWYRPDGMPAEEAQDSIWLFPCEYQLIEGE